MNVLVVGLGSMGKRRARLIAGLYPDVTLLGVDGRQDRREDAEKLLPIRTFQTIGEAVAAMNDASGAEAHNEAPGKGNCAFVCTSPLSHAAIIKECLEADLDVFTEINLVEDGYDENLRLAKEKGRTLFLSSTFLYREEIRYVKKKVAEGQAGRWNYVYHIGQYLPDWHPWETYQDFFIGNKRTNGCREILAIEMPWLTETFGRVSRVQKTSDRLTGLNIEYDDNYMILLEHENGNKGVLVVDVVSPVAVRLLEIYGEKKRLSWSGTPESLMEFDPVAGTQRQVALTEQTEHQDGYQAFVVENAYKNEIREFFRVAAGKQEQSYGFEKDRNVLRLIDEIEST